MFKNYLKIAWRQLRKQKFYSAIKIGGFALGIATCLLITLYIRNELSYDRDYPDGDRIYRITGVFNDHGTIKRGASWQAPMAAALKNDIPAVASVARQNFVGAASPRSSSFVTFGTSVTFRLILGGGQQPVQTGR